jgi:MFS family permease
MRISIIEGAFATVHIGLTGGAFLTGYALMLGAGDISLGVLAAIPFATQVFQLASAYLTVRTGKLKVFAVWGQGLGRLTWAFAAVLPFLPFVPGPLRIYAFLLFFVISSAFLMMTYNAWAVWMSDLIPERLRGRYFGIRNVVVITANLVVTVTGGRALDAFKTRGAQAEGFAVIFGAAVAAAAVAGILLARQPAMPAPAPPPAGVFWRRVAEPFRDANFRRVLRFFAAWSFSWAIPLAFWNVYMLTYLKMSYFQVALFGGVASLTGAAGHRLWGAVGDRAGNKPVLAICAAAVGFLPLFWLTTRPEFVYPVWAIAVWAGISWAGLNLVAFTMPLALSPRPSRTYYIAAFGIVSGAATFVASTLGGVIARAASGYEWVICGVVFINYHLLFVLSSLGRFVSILLLRPLREPRAVGIPTTLSYVGAALHHRLVAARQVFPEWARLRKKHVND